MPAVLKYLLLEVCISVVQRHYVCLERYRNDKGLVLAVMLKSRRCMRTCVCFESVSMVMVSLEELDWH